jgi:hypothetical protein
MKILQEDERGVRWTKTQRRQKKMWLDTSYDATNFFSRRRMPPLILPPSVCHHSHALLHFAAKPVTQKVIAQTDMAQVKHQFKENKCKY